MRAKFRIDPIEQTSHADVSKTVSPVSAPAKKKHPRILPKFPVKIIAIIVSLAIVVAIGFVVYPLLVRQDSDTSLSPVAPGPNTLSDAEVKDLVAKVRKHMQVSDETPQIVAINNVDSLKKQQPFFASAQNGDQLLVYPTRVILYRPSSDQIIDIAQIRSTPLLTPTGASTPVLTPTPTTSVIITWTPTPVQIQ